MAQALEKGEAETTAAIIWIKTAAPKVKSMPPIRIVSSNLGFDKSGNCKDSKWCIPDSNVKNATVTMSESKEALKISFALPLLLV